VFASLEKSKVLNFAKKNYAPFGVHEYDGELPPSEFYEGGGTPHLRIQTFDA
jgi:hypothetical protein